MMSCSRLLAAAALAVLVGSTANAQPVNDEFANALMIPGLPYTDTQDTTTATTAPDDPFCAGQGHTVWYAFTPAQDVRVEANTFASDYDTTLSVYTGEQGDLTQIACNDDTEFGVQSRVRFDAAADQTYFIMVGSFLDGPGGSLTLSVDEALPPVEIEVSIDRFGTFIPQTGTAVIRGTVTCSRLVSVQIFGEAVQRAGRIKVQGFYFTEVECGVSTPWQAEAVDSNARFAGGTVLAFASASAPSEEGVSDSATQRVTLRGQ